MSINTSKENSETNLYAYENQGKLVKKITYRKNLIEDLQSNNKGTFEEFDPKNIDDKTFRKFVAKAEEKDFTIYRMIKL